MNEVQRTVIDKEHGGILSITASHILINKQFKYNYMNSLI